MFATFHIRLKRKCCLSGSKAHWLWTACWRCCQGLRLAEVPDSRTADRHHQRGLEAGNEQACVGANQGQITSGGHWTPNDVGANARAGEWLLSRSARQKCSLKLHRTGSVWVESQSPTKPFQVCRSPAINRNCSSAASRSSTISKAITPGAGRLSLSANESSFSQKMSRLVLSRAISSSKP